MNNKETSSNPEVARAFNYRLWDDFWNTEWQDFNQKNYNRCPDLDNCNGWVSVAALCSAGIEQVVCDVCGLYYIRIHPSKNESLHWL